eukprot:evm.model.NODE_22070_length_83641_cov_42.053585.14
MVRLPHYEERIEAEEGDETNDIYPSSYPTIVPDRAAAAAAAIAAAKTAAGLPTSSYHLGSKAAAAAAAAAKAKAAAMDEEKEGHNELTSFAGTRNVCSAGSLRMVASEEEEAFCTLYGRCADGGRQRQKQQQQWQQRRRQTRGFSLFPASGAPPIPAAAFIV